MNKLPAIFFGHGNPMNALETNSFTEGWAAIGRTIPRPRAILCISAHWYLPATMVTAVEKPRTIHDFGGFPRKLYEVQYPAPGDTNLARRTQELLSPTTVELNTHWGLDHGTWSVLCHLYPQADIPVIQLSINETEPAPFHYELGKRLSDLRSEGVLVIGSGNIVHNLHAYSWGNRTGDAFDWAVSFENRARSLLASWNHQPLVSYENLGREALLSIPTPDHYLPLLYVIGTANQGTVTFPVEGFDGGSVSMLTVRID